MFFCSSCFQQIVISRSVKLGSFFHSSQKLNYLNPLVSNALYGSILLFLFNSFKFLSKLSASRDAKIPNKLLMPYNCTLLSFHSSPWYSKPAFSFCHVIAIQKLNSLLFCNVALKAFHRLFRKAFAYLFEIGRRPRKVFLFQFWTHDDSVYRFWSLLSK